MVAVIAQNSRNNNVTIHFTVIENIRGQINMISTRSDENTISQFSNSFQELLKLTETISQSMGVLLEPLPEQEKEIKKLLLTRIRYRSLMACDIGELLVAIKKECNFNEENPLLELTHFVPLTNYICMGEKYPAKIYIPENLSQAEINPCLQKFNSLDQSGADIVKPMKKILQYMCGLRNSPEPSQELLALATAIRNAYVLCAIKITETADLYNQAVTSFGKTTIDEWTRQLSAQYIDEMMVYRWALKDQCPPKLQTHAMLLQKMATPTQQAFILLNDYSPDSKKDQLISRIKHVGGRHRRAKAKEMITYFKNNNSMDENATLKYIQEKQFETQLLRKKKDPHTEDYYNIKDTFNGRLQFLKFINGSYSAVVGLPIYELMQELNR